MPIETPQGISRARAAADVLVERLAEQARFQIPHGDFHSAARHQVTADVRAARADFGRASKIVMQHARRDIIAQDQPGRFGPLFVVERILARGDFAPAGNAAADDFHQHDAALGGPAEAGLKEMHQRHPDFAQRDSF